MSKGKDLSANDRITQLLDESSFVEVGAYVTARSTDFNVQDVDTPKDGVITGYGTINDKLVYVYSQDISVLSGAVGEMHAKKIAKLYDMAGKVNAPIIGLIDSAGMRLQEASDALNAFARIYMKQTLCSGIIPQITAVLGTCGGGAALIPGMSDFTFMRNDAKIFVNSPNSLSGNYVEKLDTSSAEYLSSNTNLIDGRADTDEEVLSQIRDLINILPDAFTVDISDPDDDPNRTIPNLDSLKDDGREVIKNIADDNYYFELKSEFGTDITCGLIKLGGKTTGVIASQAAKSKVLSTEGAVKSAKLINFCDAFDIPIVTLVNVQGFKATVGEEAKAARSYSKLAAAYANSDVPAVTVLMGDAYGSAYTIMNSKSLGADIVYSWPKAKVGMMDSEMAVKIMYADELDKADDKAAFLSDMKKKYEDVQSSPSASAARGYIDDIIEPDATRKRIIAALYMLDTKSEVRAYKKHTTI